ncbi:DNA-deoxyinosine glycosylase, partial [Candidatus Woesearchaeota archaeon]
MKHSFPPVIDERTRVLVLGSMPGEESLRKQEYYAHPQNAFWRIMEELLETPLTKMPYPTRTRALLREGIGLWDVYRACEREGSSDGAIRKPQRNPLRDMLTMHPRVERVVCNGRTAHKEALSLLAGTGVEVLL